MIGKKSFDLFDVLWEFYGTPLLKFHSLSAMFQNFENILKYSVKGNFGCLKLVNRIKPI